MFRLALEMVRHHADSELISPDDLAMLQSEVAGVLKGLDDNARFAGRMDDVLGNLFASRR